LPALLCTRGTVIIIHSKHHAVPMFPWPSREDVTYRKRGDTELLGTPGIERTAFPRILMFSH
jgi:hypothetical protein